MSMILDLACPWVKWPTRRTLYRLRRPLPRNEVADMACINATAEAFGGAEGARSATGGTWRPDGGESRCHFVPC